MKQPILEISKEVAIPLSELDFVFTRSSGPGGQHVNKVSTRVEVIFDVVNSPSLTADQKETIVRKLKTRISRDGKIRVAAGESRSQFQNKREALRKLTEQIGQSLKRQKKRKKTASTNASREKRLRVKSRRSETKKTRKSVARED